MVAVKEREHSLQNLHNHLIAFSATGSVAERGVKVDTSRGNNLINIGETIYHG